MHADNSKNNLLPRAKDFNRDNRLSLSFKMAKVGSVAVVLWCILFPFVHGRSIPVEHNPMINICRTTETDQNFDFNKVCNCMICIL